MGGPTDRGRERERGSGRVLNPPGCGPSMAGLARIRVDGRSVVGEQRREVSLSGGDRTDAGSRSRASRSSRPSGHTPATWRPSGTASWARATSWTILVQDVFLSAQTTLPELRHAEAIRGWLATVTVRVARRRLRARRLRRFSAPADLDRADDVPDRAASPETQVAGQGHLPGAGYAARQRPPGLEPALPAGRAAGERGRAVRLLAGGGEAPAGAGPGGAGPGAGDRRVTPWVTAMGDHHSKTPEEPQPPPGAPRDAGRTERPALDREARLRPVREALTLDSDRTGCAPWPRGSPIGSGRAPAAGGSSSPPGRRRRWRCSCSSPRERRPSSRPALAGGETAAPAPGAGPRISPPELAGDRPSRPSRPSLRTASRDRGRAGWRPARQAADLAQAAERWAAYVRSPDTSATLAQRQLRRLPLRRAPPARTRRAWSTSSSRPSERRATAPPTTRPPSGGPRQRRGGGGRRLPARRRLPRSPACCSSTAAAPSFAARAGPERACSSSQTLDEALGPSMAGPLSRWEWAGGLLWFAPAQPPELSLPPRRAAERPETCRAAARAGPATAGRSVRRWPGSSSRPRAAIGRWRWPTPGGSSRATWCPWWCPPRRRCWRRAGRRQPSRGRGRPRARRVGGRALAGGDRRHPGQRRHPGAAAALRRAAGGRPRPTRLRPPLLAAIPTSPNDSRRGGRAADPGHAAAAAVGPRQRRAPAPRRALRLERPLLPQHRPRLRPPGHRGQRRPGDGAPWPARTSAWKRSSCARRACPRGCTPTGRSPSGRSRTTCWCRGCRWIPAGAASASKARASCSPGAAATSPT